jgi:hypothetical protein
MGVGWHEHGACLFRGTEGFWPGYMRHLLSEWIPLLHGIQAGLEADANVADVGCGHGGHPEHGVTIWLKPDADSPHRHPANPTSADSPSKTLDPGAMRSA